MTLFFQDLMMVDSVFKLSDSDRFFITVDSSTKIKSYLVPKNQMCRFQFLEIFVRAAIERHFTLEHNTKSEAEALEKTCTEHLLVHRQFTNIHKWRIEKIWNEPVDNILKAYRPLFERLYELYSGCKNPGKPIVMDIDDFEKLVNNSTGLISEGTLSQRDLSLFFF